MFKEEAISNGIRLENPSFVVDWAGVERGTKFQRSRALPGKTPWQPPFSSPWACLSNSLAQALTPYAQCLGYGC